MSPRVIMIVLVVGAVLHALNVLAGAMLPPPPGQERTWYGYWFRVAQLFAANSGKIEAALPTIAREIAAEAHKPVSTSVETKVSESPRQSGFLDHLNAEADDGLEARIVHMLHRHQAGETTGNVAPEEKPMSTTTTAASVASISELKKAEQEFVTVLEKAGRDFEKGLAFAVKYLPAATTLASLLFPAAAAGLTEASVTATLIQNAVTEVEQKYAASGAQSGTGPQKAADVLTLVNSAVQTLLATPTIAAELKSANITVNTTYVQNLINAVVGFLNIQGAATT